MLTPENALQVLPRFYGLSSRDAAFVAASIRPVENPPRRDFHVTELRPKQEPKPSRPDPLVGSLQLRAPETPSAKSAPAPSVALDFPRPADRPSVKPLDAERARVSMTVSRRLLDKLAAARDALSHSHPGASEETILEVGLDLILQRHAKRRGLGAKARAASPKCSEPVAAYGRSPGRRPDSRGPRLTSPRSAGSRGTGRWTASPPRPSARACGRRASGPAGGCAR